MDMIGCEFFWLRMDNQFEYVDYVFWQFGNVVQDSSWDGVYIFRDIGQYDIMFIVGNGSGCVDMLMLFNVVNVQGSLQAGFIYDKFDNEFGSIYQFFNDSSLDVEIFDWFFGDGVIFGQENLVYCYLLSFDKEVWQIVCNEVGCFDMVYVLIDFDILFGLFVFNVLEFVIGISLEKQVFLFKGIGLFEYEIVVYVWIGQLIWLSIVFDEEGQFIEFWDGILNGQDLFVGVFVWKVYWVCFYNNIFWDGMFDEQGVLRWSGFFYLVR